MAAEAGSLARSRAGRRPGSTDTRAVILAAAKAEFAANGFDKTSMRGIARAAQVDPALVHHYFGSKDDLLLASLEAPFDPRQVIGALAEPGPEGLGTRIATTFLNIWDDEEQRLPLVALVKSAMTTETAADLLRNGIVRMVLVSISSAIDAEDAELRAQLVASHLLGLVMTRYVLELEPLASTPVDVLAERLAPTLQRYIDGNVTSGT
ncbi:MAG: TetR family transcriptional regulator [Nocardioidaceae bacterium]